MTSHSVNQIPPGLVIAAPRSGAGKTTITLGLLQALKRRGIIVQPFKCGPDYIDPAFHTAATGRASYNLDSWAMSQSLTDALVAQACEGATAVVVEALMGLFDGVASPGAWGIGASADIAAATGWPVVLVLDVSGQSQTAAAVARGFRGYREGVEIAGVILNRVGSPRHVRLASLALAAAGIPVLGAIPRQTEIIMPERHLGLVQAEETPELATRLDALANLIETHVDVDAVLAAMRSGHLRFTPDSAAPVTVGLPPPGQRIALARDAAFSFVYPHLTTLWRAAGAEIVPFSPLNDEAPDPTCDIAWLPGGYPELHAGQLATNAQFMAGTRAFAARKSIHGECGGYMTLGQCLIDSTGQRHAMLGLLSLETSFAKRRMQLGYRRATLKADSPIGPAGASIRGHEFHYATILANDDDPLCDLFDADGTLLDQKGSARGHITGSFFHAIAPA